MLEYCAYIYIYIANNLEEILRESCAAADHRNFTMPRRSKADYSTETKMGVIIIDDQFSSFDCQSFNLFVLIFSDEKIIDSFQFSDHQFDIFF